MNHFAALALLLAVLAQQPRPAAAQGPGTGSIRSSERAAERPNQSEASPDDCVIVAIAGTLDPERRLEDFPDDDEGETFECEYADGTTVPLELDNDQLTELREWLNGKLPDAAGGPFKSGEQTLSREGSSVGANGAIRPPPGVTMSSLVRQDNNGRGRGPPTGRHLREQQNRRRRTAEVVGEKYVLIIIADFPDYPFTGNGHYTDLGYNTQAEKAAAVSDDVFGSFSGGGTDPVNLAQQLHDCSFGKLSILPKSDPTWTGTNSATLSEAQLDAASLGKGVMYVTMTQNLASYTSETTIRNEMKAAAEAQLPADVVLPGPFDHVIFVRDRCLAGVNGGCGYAAYASVNGWYQMFVARYIKDTGVQTHEMGHNLNLAHSGSEGFSSNPAMTGDSDGEIKEGGYTDHTCSMGNPLYEDDIGKMCFNAAKNFQIPGWYDDAKITIDPAGFNGPPSYSWAGKILGVGEYDKRGSAGWPVSIKVETGTPNDYFVGFNRAAGPNSQNDLADDFVTVVRTGQDGVGYSQSYLDMLLDDTADYSEFQVQAFKKSIRGEGLPLTVKVNSIDTTSSPGSADVFIGYENCVGKPDTYCGTTKTYPSCFESSTCFGQGADGTELDGCNHDPKAGCCGNEVCEPGETQQNCPFDCYIGPRDLLAEKCPGCYIKDGMMYDIEAKADSDLTVTGLDYYPYNSGATYEVWAKAGPSPVASGFVSGTNLEADGWTNVAAVTACGAWKFCKIEFTESLQVPRGTYMAFAVTGVNGADLLYYQGGSTILEDEFLKLHPARPFNYANGAASSFSSVRTYNGMITYYADLSPPAPECTDDAECSDGLFCNGAEQCLNGSCQAGAPPVCDDGISCTIDTCNEQTDSCDHAPNDGLCDNGQWCDGAETCSATLGCQAGTPPNCDDGVACTIDTCNEATDSCDNTPNHASCSDGIFCNGSEICDPTNGCEDGAAPCADICDETNDVCVECTSDTDCDDGLFCNGQETCNNGICQDGNDACPGQFCIEASNSCVDCQDNSDCEDGNVCNGSETCVAGSCVAGTALNCPDDGLFCNGDEVCDPIGGCKNANVPCAGQMCDDERDVCVECLVDDDCDDGNFCNGSETCSAGECQLGPPPCAAGDICNETTDSCEAFSCESTYSSKDPCNTDPESRCFWGDLSCSGPSNSGNTSRNKCCPCGDGGCGGGGDGGGGGGGGDCSTLSKGDCNKDPNCTGSGNGSSFKCEPVSASPVICSERNGVCSVDEDCCDASSYCKGNGRCS